VKFLALIYGDEQAWDDLGEADRTAIYAKYRSFSEDAGAAGKLVDGAEIQPSRTATTVRVRDDETIVADGPFTETKEALGGFFVLDCDTMDEAVALAARIPGAEHGAVEVRPAHEEDQG
jgi:hypothetical protein